ncbi:hypothetical protein SAMN04489796_102295 [Winogradskyella thalassocola]|uniref:Uncharacterized protein n=1 Tax=Winogradskyella thalassocola TaxID=262004 RepID=A0A1G8BC32_9FLAO|nr:hypothetical protein SAMN04489796_102295 [Winogradskyella thalassocola]
MIKRTPPNSSILYGKRLPGEPMNIKLIGIFHSFESLVMSSGPKLASNSMNSILIKGYS